MAMSSVCLQDTLCTAGLQTTAAARILEGYTPSHDATSVALLKAAGGIVVGKCNCDAFAMGSTNESSDYKVMQCLAEWLTYCCHHVKA
jgi:aspartyl-tRNA(Asn)/glutamyl-tRNA(Gln) amidotransferase subunit A